jgi:hypothetical protein
MPNYTDESSSGSYSNLPKGPASLNVSAED